MVRPNKAYFLISISKKEQKERKEKIGSISLHLDEGDMSRNMQYGEIVDMGSKAQSILPQAKIGDLLIVHHFVEGDKESREDSLVFENDEHRYYVVSSYAQAGKATEVFGVWNGETVIPHPEYLFLKKDQPVISDTNKDAYLNQAMEATKSGILVFKEYHVARESHTETLERLKTEAMHLGKMKQTPDVIKAIEAKQDEMLAITKKMNASTFKPYHVKFAPYVLNEWFDREVKENDIIYCQNTAAEMEVEFKEETFIVCPTKYIGWMLN